MYSRQGEVPSHLVPLCGCWKWPLLFLICWDSFGMSGTVFVCSHGIFLCRFGDWGQRVVVSEGGEGTSGWVGAYVEVDEQFAVRTFGFSLLLYLDYLSTD